MNRFIKAACSIALAASMVPTAAFADGAQTIVKPSSDGVTNQAAKIELADVRADAHFYLYKYDGTQQLVFPEGDYPYYKDSHTVTLTLTGNDSSKVCDDNIACFSGNECDVDTTAQDKTGGNTRTCTVEAQDHGGPAPYTVIASSGQTATFLPITVYIPSSLSLDQETMSLAAGGVGRLNPSNAAVSWTSSDESVATVSPAGIVTGVKDGTATVTATYAEYGLHLSTTCKVSVGIGSTVKKDGTYLVGSGSRRARFTVTDTVKHHVIYSACASASSKATVPSKVTLSDGKAYTVTAISAKAFRSALGVRTVIVRSITLSKSTVRGCLKASKVTTVKLTRYGAYKKFFTKTNCGKKVKVKKA